RASTTGWPVRPRSVWKEGLRSLDFGRSLACRRTTQRVGGNDGDEVGEGHLCGGRRHGGGEDVRGRWAGGGGGGPWVALSWAQTHRVGRWCRGGGRHAPRG